MIEGAARGARTVLGDSAVLLGLFFWIDLPKRSEALEVNDRVLARVKPALAGAGIDIPHPTVQALLRDRTEATDGDRARHREGWPARGGDREGRPRRPNGAAGQPS